jgi:hypothetical protein
LMQNGISDANMVVNSKWVERIVQGKKL